MFWLSFILALLMGLVNITQISAMTSESSTIIYLETILEWPCDPFDTSDTEICWWNITTGNTGP